MLKKTVKYHDFNGIEREEDFYFNLTHQEIVEMEMTSAGGLSDRVKTIIAEQDIDKIMEMFKDLVLKAHGEKSPDGRYFVKNDETRARFASTQAFSDIFIELATDDKAAVAFVNGITPVAGPKTQALIDRAAKEAEGKNTNES